MTTSMQGKWSALPNDNNQEGWSSGSNLKPTSYLSNKAGFAEDYGLGTCLGLETKKKTKHKKHITNNEYIHYSILEYVLTKYSIQNIQRFTMH